MIDAILPARIVRDRQGSQLVRYRPLSACVVAMEAGAGPLRAELRASASYAIPWDGFRLEERYGALVSTQRYVARKTPACGLFVNLFV